MDTFFKTNVASAVSVYSIIVIILFYYIFFNLEGFVVNILFRNIPCFSSRPSIS